MSGRLTLEIVTPLGTRLHERGIDRIVLRRREEDHDPGSQVVVLPSHAPLLVQTPAFDLCFSRDSSAYTVHVEPGVAEVLEDSVTLLTSAVGEIRS